MEKSLVFSKVFYEFLEADNKIRDYSGKTADFYILMDKKHKEGSTPSSSEYYDDKSKSQHGKQVKKVKSRIDRNTLSGPIIPSNAPISSAHFPAQILFGTK